MIHARNACVVAGVIGLLALSELSCRTTALRGYALVPGPSATPSPSPSPGVPSGPSAASGLRYFVAKDLVQIQSVLTIRTSREVEACEEWESKCQTEYDEARAACDTRRESGSDPDGCHSRVASRLGSCKKARPDDCDGFFFVTNKRFERDTRTSLLTVADTALPFVLDLFPGGITDSSVKVKLRSSGLLESVNAESTGRAGDVIVGVGRLFGSLTGAVLGLPLSLPAVMQPPGVERAESLCPPSETAGKLTTRYRALVYASSIACDGWQEATRLATELSRQLESRPDIERKAVLATGSDGPAARYELETLRVSIGDHERELAARGIRFQRLLDDYVQANGLGTRTETSTTTSLVEVYDLPTEKAMAPQQKLKSAYSIVEKTPAGRAFEETCAVVSISEDAVDDASGEPQAGFPCWIGDDTKGECKGLAHIYFRGARSRRLTVYGFLGVDSCLTAEDRERNAEATRVQIGRGMHEVVSAREPVRHLAFKGSAFAERGLALTFDEKGRPTELERSGKSDAAAATRSLADALKASRDEYADSVKVLAAADADRRKLQLSALTTKAEELEKQKQILEGKLTVAAGSATFDDMLRKKELDAEAGALSAEIALAAALATSEQKLELEKLKAEVELLKQQVAVLSTLKDLEAARKK